MKTCSDCKDITDTFVMKIVDRIAAEKEILTGVAGKLTAEETANHRGKLWAFEKALEIFRNT